MDGWDASRGQEKELPPSGKIEMLTTYIHETRDTGGDLRPILDTLTHWHPPAYLQEMDFPRSDEMMVDTHTL